jgi:hypothetical protein
VNTSLIGLAALAIASSVSAQSTATMPDPGANGGLLPNTSMRYPWDRVADFVNVASFYSNANFVSHGITFPILISGVDTWCNLPGGANVATHPNVTVYVGEGRPGVHAAYDVNQSFAWHYAGGNLPPPAFTGSVTTVATGAPGYFAPITFPAPIPFDPTSGADLVVQYENDATGTTGPGTTSHGPSGPGSLASRIFTQTPGGGPRFANATYAVQTQISFNPAPGLHPGFTVDVESGASPLTVNFTDTSQSSAPGGILAWVWDFDNDGTPDSTLQNPSHTYTTCGPFDVSLTVLDATHGTRTLVVPALIETDPLTAGFIISPGANNTVSFTDTSTIAPTGWAWDFDNDGVVDSTVQNPTHIYPSGGLYTASLTVTNACSTDTHVEQISTFPILCVETVGGDGLNAAGAGNLFDVIITHPNGVLITGLDVSAFTASAVGTVEVWLAPDTYVGKESNAAAWHKVSEATGVNLRGLDGLVDFADIDDLYLAPGTYGMRVATSNGVRDTSGANPAPASNIYANADITVAAGAGQVTFGRGVNSSNVWNGCIHYSNDPADGFFSGHRAGCDGSAGRTTISSTTVPAVGQTHVIDVESMPANGAGILVLGYGDQSFNGNPLPLDLAFLGMPGCPLNIEPQDNFLILADGSGSAQWNLVVPNVPAFIGTLFWNQALVIDAGVNNLGAVMSDSVVGRIGS